MSSSRLILIFRQFSHLRIFLYRKVFMMLQIGQCHFETLLLREAVRDLNLNVTAGLIIFILYVICNPFHQASSECRSAYKTRKSVESKIRNAFFSFHNKGYLIFVILTFCIPYRPRMAYFRQQDSGHVSFKREKCHLAVTQKDRKILTTLKKRKQGAKGYKSTEKCFKQVCRLHETGCRQTCNRLQARRKQVTCILLLCIKIIRNEY